MKNNVHALESITSAKLSESDIEDVEIEMDAAWTKIERARRYLRQSRVASSLAAMHAAVGDMQEAIELLERTKQHVG